MCFKTNIIIDDLEKKNLYDRFLVFNKEVLNLTYHFICKYLFKI